MSRWWEGMDWLKRPPEEWPKSNVTPDFDIINSEKRKITRAKRFNLRPKPIVEAPLPEDRVKEVTVFEVVGIDYAGPLILRDNNDSNFNGAEKFTEENRLERYFYSGSQKDYLKFNPPSAPWWGGS
ncbi:hypothetical protein TNIN_391831 [Trichonephila inaurata madagascariensis]|uniref:Uncharacterized protein n=1 Tax=Trichonephila inaurata madagascariensis TaxID=2747483 RepID=A0A8X6YKU3_9ARAC|nr:hypothetical protein TNIN_391831 [Trichonephila inaurata madagascariensis]